MVVLYVVVLDVGCCLVPCVPGVPENVSTTGSRVGSSLSLLRNAVCAHIVTPDLCEAIFYFVDRD